MAEKQKPTDREAVYDAEMVAMRKVAKIMKGLEPDARQRVLKWIEARCGIQQSQPGMPVGALPAYPNGNAFAPRQ